MKKKDISFLVGPRSLLHIYLSIYVCVCVCLCIYMFTNTHSLSLSPSLSLSLSHTHIHTYMGINKDGAFIFEQNMKAAAQQIIQVKCWALLGNSEWTHKQPSLVGFNTWTHQQKFIFISSVWHWMSSRRLAKSDG